MITAFLNILFGSKYIFFFFLILLENSEGNILLVSTLNFFVKSKPVSFLSDLTLLKVNNFLKVFFAFFSFFFFCLLSVFVETVSKGSKLKSKFILLLFIGLFIFVILNSCFIFGFIKFTSEPTL